MTTPEALVISVTTAMQLWIIFYFIKANGELLFSPLFGQQYRLCFMVDHSYRTDALLALNNHAFTDSTRFHHLLLHYVVLFGHFYEVEKSRIKKADQNDRLSSYIGFLDYFANSTPMLMSPFSVSSIPSNADFS